MKAIYTLGSLFILAVNSLAGQNLETRQITLDTIYANDQKNVALFFPDPIRQGITGSSNFVFTYNKEHQQHLGLLQATPGKESNLLVISSSGLVFSYLVRYSEKLEKLNYFISKSSSIGNEDPNFQNEKRIEIQATADLHSREFLTPEEESYFKKFSSAFLRSKQKFRVISEAEQGIILRVRNIVFKRDELFFVMEIENNSPIDYEMNYLNISVETRQKGKKKSIQKLVQEPDYKYLEPTKIPSGKISRFIYVLPKFSIAEDKVVLIDLNELNGERDIKLKLKQKVINNPN